MDIEINVKNVDNNTLVMEIKSEIGVYTSPKFKKEIDEIFKKKISFLILNLEDTRHIDGKGIAVLCGTRKKMHQENPSIKDPILIIVTNPQIKKVFNTTGLVRIFPIFKNEEDALKYIKNV